MTEKPELKFIKRAFFAFVAYAAVAAIPAVIMHRTTPDGPVKANTGSHALKMEFSSPNSIYVGNLSREDTLYFSAENINCLVDAAALDLNAEYGKQLATVSGNGLSGRSEFEAEYLTRLDLTFGENGGIAVVESGGFKLIEFTGIESGMINASEYRELSSSNSTTELAPVQGEPIPHFEGDPVRLAFSRDSNEATTVFRIKIPTKGFDWSEAGFSVHPTKIELANASTTDMTFDRTSLGAPKNSNLRFTAVDTLTVDLKGANEGRFGVVLTGDVQEIAITDSSGHTDLRPNYWNKTAEGGLSTPRTFLPYLFVVAFFKIVFPCALVLLVLPLTFEYFKNLFWPPKANAPA